MKNMAKILLFLDAIASLDLGYESKSVRIIKPHNEYIAKHWMYIEYILNVHWIDIEFTLNTYWMDIECTLNGHWIHK